MTPETYRRIALAALVLQVAIVVTGGLVRLTGSGLGCTEWPNCESGRVLPESEFHGWVEYGNRLFVIAVSVSVVAAVVGAYLRRPRRADLVWLSWGLVVGVAAQIVLGAIVVRTHLVPSAVSAHFLLSMALVADAAVLYRRSGQTRTPPVPRTSTLVRRMSVVLVGWVALVLFLGTLVTGTGPHSGDPEVVDRLSFEISDVVRVHAGAVWVLVALTVAVLVTAWRQRAPSDVLRRGEALLGLMIAQGAIGYLQYFNGVPEGLVALHLLGATLVWVGALWFHLGLVERPGEERTETAEPAPLRPAELSTA